jgi:hypothetical protein
VGLPDLPPSLVATAHDALARTMSETAALAAAVLDDNHAARVFDTMLDQSPPLRTVITDSLADADLAGVLVKTPERLPAEAASPRPVAPPAPVMSPAPAFEMFDELFAVGWSAEGTWNGKAQTASDVTPFSGATAIAWTTGSRGGFKLTGEKAVDTTGYRTLTFALRAGRAAQPLQLQALDGTRPLGHPVALAKYGGDPPAEAWKRYDVPLAALAAVDRPINGFMLLEATGEAQPTLYLDRVGLER